MLVSPIRAVFATLVFAALPAVAADQPPAPPTKPMAHADVPIKPVASDAAPAEAAADTAAAKKATPHKKHHRKHHKKATTPAAPTPPPIKPDAAATPAAPTPPPIKPAGGN